MNVDESAGVDEPIDVDEPVTLEEIIGTATPSSSEEKSASSTSIIRNDPEKLQQIKECVDNLLCLLGLNKMDDAKMRGKKYQSSIFSELQIRLNKILFTEATPPDAGDQIIGQLKEKYNEDTTNRATKIKILSVLPKTWSPADIRREFGEHVSLRMIYSMKNLVSLNGILCDTTKKTRTMMCANVTLK